MGITQVTRNFQVTLPKDVREQGDIRIGDALSVTAEGEEIVIRKLRREIVDKCGGSWGKGESGVVTVRKIRDESEERVRRLGL